MGFEGFWKLVQNLSEPIQMAHGVSLKTACTVGAWGFLQGIAQEAVPPIDNYVDAYQTPVHTNIH